MRSEMNILLNQFAVFKNDTQNSSSDKEKITSTSKTDRKNETEKKQEKEETQSKKKDQNTNSKASDKRKGKREQNKSSNLEPIKNRNKRDNYRNKNDCICQTCGKSFATQNYLYNHIEYKHVNDARPKCIYCNIRFSSKWDQDDHYSRKHYHRHDTYPTYQYNSDRYDRWENEFPPLRKPRAPLNFHRQDEYDYQQYRGNAWRAGPPAQY